MRDSWPDGFTRADLCRRGACPFDQALNQMSAFSSISTAGVVSSLWSAGLGNAAASTTFGSWSGCHELSVPASAGGAHTEPAVRTFLRLCAERGVQHAPVSALDRCARPCSLTADARRRRRGRCAQSRPTPVQDSAGPRVASFACSLAFPPPIVIVSATTDSARADALCPRQQRHAAQVEALGGQRTCLRSTLKRALDRGPS